jgi:hypothetical protein
MLMRNGFLPLQMYDLTPDRLASAGMLVCIGPARSYSTSECDQIERFVREGGLFVYMVGAEEAPPSENLLTRFGVGVPRSPVRPGDVRAEPQPMGSFVTRYPADADPDRGDQTWQVKFYTGWPVASSGSDVAIHTMGTVKQPTIDPLNPDGDPISEESFPVVVSRRFGSGRIVLIGDTNFALFKNLEYGQGEAGPAQGGNADYWRWLISQTTNRRKWTPPQPAQVEEAPE